MCLEVPQTILIGRDGERIVEEVEHTIDTGDSKPIREAAQWVPFALQEKISEMVKEMLKGGIISESSSPWASPVVIVCKKDGSLCFCID